MPFIAVMTLRHYHYCFSLLFIIIDQAKEILRVSFLHMLITGDIILLPLVIYAPPCHIFDITCLCLKHIVDYYYIYFSGTANICHATPWYYFAAGIFAADGLRLSFGRHHYYYWLCHYIRWLLRALLCRRYAAVCRCRLTPSYEAIRRRWLILLALLFIIAAAAPAINILADICCQRCYKRYF